MNTFQRRISILLAALYMTFPSASIAERLAPPSVSLKKSAAGNVTISWRIARGKFGYVAADKLLIERRKAGGEIMQFVAEYPGHTGKWVDTPEEDGTYLYKLRTARGHKRSAVKTLRAKVDLTVPELRPLNEGFYRCENSEMGDLINAERKKAGLTELVHHPLLESAADSLTIDSRSGIGWSPADADSYLSAASFAGDAFNNLGYYGPSAATDWIVRAMNRECNKGMILRSDYRYMGEVCLMDSYGYPVRFIIIAGPDRIYS